MEIQARKLKRLAPRCGLSQESILSACDSSVWLSAATAFAQDCNAAEYDSSLVFQAVQASVATLTSENSDVFLALLGDASSELLARAGAELGCHFPPSSGGADQPSPLVLVSRQAQSCDPFNEEADYCGQGDTCTGPFPGLRVSAGVSWCLNYGCFQHDRCYGGLHQTDCVETDTCMWTPLTSTCDDNFFIRFSYCEQQRETCQSGCSILNPLCLLGCSDTWCNTTCKATAAGASLIQDIQHRLRDTCTVNGPRDCTTCADGCCQDAFYQDCQYVGGCGDGKCSGETCYTCLEDCSATCPTACGDGVCVAGESCYGIGSCPEPACAPEPGVEVSCANGQDDDCDLLTDCRDPDCVIPCGGLPCVPNATQSCSTGLVGICGPGTRTCNAQGTGYGSCVQNQQAQTETIAAGTCNNGLDDDCDGATDGADSSCTCIPNSTQSCSTGLPGICSSGTRTCNAQGTGYGSCVQNQQAQTETIAAGTCSNGLDDDCDGATDGADSGCPTCGDGRCTGGETCLTCQQDCGACLPGAFTLGVPWVTCPNKVPRSDLSWTSSSGVASYNVLRNSSVIASLSGATTVYHDTGIAFGQDLTWQIRANNSAGSTLSNSQRRSLISCCAQVSGTGVQGLRVRSGAGLSYEQVGSLYDGDLTMIYGGPVSQDGYMWYRVYDRTGIPGWTAGDWLFPYGGNGICG